MTASIADTYLGLCQPVGRYIDTEDTQKGGRSCSY